MPVTESGIRGRWAALAADPDRARQIQAAGRQRAAEAAQPRIVVLAPAAPVATMQRPELVSDADAGRVNLYEEIDPWFGITAQEFCAAIAKVPGDLQVNINSPGGSLADSKAIYSTLKQRTGTVTVVIDGLAASGASLIMCAASPGRLFAAEHATAMAHDALTITAGNQQDHLEMAELLGRESQLIAGIYAARAGGSADRWREVMRAETWYVGGAEIVAAGLADQILPDGGSPPEPGSWAALAAQLDTRARVASAGPGTPGGPAVRAAVYSQWTARSGRGPGRVSPTVAAIFRL